MKHKNNLHNADDLKTFYKITKEAAMNIYDDEDIALWHRLFNYIIMEVEFDENYIPSSISKKLSQYFGLSVSNIHRALRKLVEKEWLIKYPIGAKRASGYLINPRLFWVGSDNSQDQKIKVIKNTYNRLQVEIDTTGQDSVTVVLVDKEKREEVKTDWTQESKAIDVDAEAA